MRWSHIALFLLLASVLASPVAVADGPFETNRTGTTRTIQWTTAGNGSLAFQDVELEAGQAVLAWRDAGFAWSRAGQIAANGTVDPALDATSGALELRADVRNHVLAGDFSAEVPWTFLNGTSGATTARWDAAVGEARFEHVSGPNQTRWDSLDSAADWNGIGSSGGSSSSLTTVTSGQKEGDGMIQAEVTTAPFPSAWAGALRTGAFNWSSYDRLLVWVLAPNVSPFTVAFNVTALIGPSVRATTAQPLREGWQELMFDLTELGPGLNTISQVTLRFNGGFLDNEVFYLDDVRLLRPKRFNETAETRQTIEKANATSSSRGIATLGYAWSVENASGISRIDSVVRVEGPSGTYEHTSSTSSAGAWRSVFLDVGDWFALPGSYVVRLQARYELDTYLGSNGTLRIDNVDLRFPGRQNGSFLSRSIDLGVRVERLGLSWNASLPAGTSTRVSFRTGNTSTAGDGTWSAWLDSTAPADRVLTGSARYAQVKLDLGTTNASVGPRLFGVAFDARSRTPIGSVTTLPFAAGADFVSWRGFDAGSAPGPAGSISFAVSADGNWTAIATGTDLRGLTLGTTIRLRSVLSSTDGLATPRLFWLSLVYEVEGGLGVGQFVVDPLVLVALASVGLAYAGYSFVTRRAYAVEDLFLVARDGRLILHSTNRLHADRDEDLFAGMLTAMSSFVKDTFKEERGGLRQFAVGGKQVLIERVDSVFLAAIYVNRVPRWAPKNLRALAEDLQSQFGDRLRHWSGSSEDLQDLRALTDRFLRKTRYRRGPFPGRAA